MKLFNPLIEYRTTVDRTWLSIQADKQQSWSGNSGGVVKIWKTQVGFVDSTTFNRTLQIWPLWYFDEKTAILEWNTEFTRIQMIECFPCIQCVVENYYCTSAWRSHHPSELRWMQQVQQSGLDLSIFMWSSQSLQLYPIENLWQNLDVCSQLLSR